MHWLIKIEVLLFKNYKGIALKDLGRDEDAIKNYTKAIEIDPHYALAYNNRGITFQKKLRNFIEQVRKKRRCYKRLNQSY